MSSVIANESDIKVSNSFGKGRSLKKTFCDVD